MSQDHLPDALFEEAPAAAASARRVRGASVTLRDHGPEGDDPGSLMDPATKSLTDALRITFRLLQFAMVVLAAIFLFSGSQSVQQGERGIRVVLGKPVDSDLQAGFCWSFPYPIGELVKVPLASPAISINEAFWPFLSPQEKNMTVAELAGGGLDTLSPERDGSLLTAEGYLAHTRCVIKYRRDDPALAHQRFPSQSEETKIVMAAVRRGVIHAAASMSADEFIKDIPDSTREGDFRPADAIAREVAQDVLNTMECGLVLEDISLLDRMPPRRVASDYNRPAQAQSEAGRQEENAKEERRSTLTSVAGQAADLILSQIDLYEEQLKLGKAEEAEQTHARIDALLLGEPVEIPGVEVIPRIDGAVPSLLAEARQYRSTIVSATQADVERFRAIREGYRSNPEVVLHREWSDALTAFLTRPNVQTQLLPQGERWVIQINRDPGLTRDQEAERLLQYNKEREQERLKERERARFERRADPNKTRASE